jgi:hypothetical protein
MQKKMNMAILMNRCTVLSFHCLGHGGGWLGRGCHYWTLFVDECIFNMVGGCISHSTITNPSPLLTTKELLLLLLMMVTNEDE